MTGPRRPPAPPGDSRPAPPAQYHSGSLRELFERWKRARTSEDFAWACLVTNAVGVPGMGTLMIRRWEGVPQLGLSIAGGVLMTWWIAGFAIAELRTME